MKLNILLILILLVTASCGEESIEEQITSDNCSINSDIFNRTYDQESTGYRYDITGCSAGVTCRVCFNNDCTDSRDIDITYYSNGTLTINYFNTSNGELSARWKICNGNELRMYNFSDGSSEERFTAIN